MSTTGVTYPLADTHAERILEYIRANPETSRNGIISALELNPSIVRRYVQVLLDRELIVDEQTEEGHHRYSKKPTE